MTIEIHKPELEALIEERLKKGPFRDVEEMLLNVLKAKDSSSSNPFQRLPGQKSLAQLFDESPFKGLNLDFERDQDELPSADL